MKRVTLFPRQGYRTHPRSPITDAAVAGSVTILSYPLNNRRRARLLLHRILVVAVAQGMFFEKAIGAGGGITAIEADWCTCPRTIIANIPPSFGFRTVTAPGFGKHPVNLLKRQALDRVILVDKHCQRVERGAQRCWFVTIFGLEGINLTAFHWP